jgi:hypothetical protein
MSPMEVIVCIWLIAEVTSTADDGRLSMFLACGHAAYSVFRLYRTAHAL